MKLHLTGRKTVFFSPTTPCIVIMAWLGSSECQLRTLLSSVSPSGFSSTSINFYWLFDLCWNSMQKWRKFAHALEINFFLFIFVPLKLVKRHFLLRGRGPVSLCFTSSTDMSPFRQKPHALLPKYDVNIFSLWFYSVIRVFVYTASNANCLLQVDDFVCLV